MVNTTMLNFHLALNLCAPVVEASWFKSPALLAM